MSLSEAATKIFHQPEVMIHQIWNLDYMESDYVLSGSTIGQHVRHTLELFTCFQAGFQHSIWMSTPDIKLNHEFGVAASTIRFNIAMFISNRYSSGSC